MNYLIDRVESVLSTIRESEFRKNPKASAKALEIRKMIIELKKYVSANSQNSTNQGVLKYINSKMLLEN